RSMPWLNFGRALDECAEPLDPFDPLAPFTPLDPFDPWEPFEPVAPSAADAPAAAATGVAFPWRISLMSIARTSRGVRCRWAWLTSSPSLKSRAFSSRRNFSSLGGLGTRPV